jgi:arabinofuranan 3-O-arabinosyltransferase
VRRDRGALIPLGLGALAFALALLQRPGVAVADTKIDLHVDPAGFLAEVAALWSASSGLGQVQAGQYAGYLFPMGPFFALGHALGLPDWLVQRLWLGALLALAAWGAVRLMDALFSPQRGVAHVIAGALVILNPYVVVFANRTSVTLLGYAALPWLLQIVHRTMGQPRGWRMPAAFALVLACTGGGVNAAVTAWLLVGPLLLLGYEAWLGDGRWRAAGSVLARAAPLSVAASLWWIVPVAAHAGYGLNFLPFTESAGAIWETTSASEVLRLGGYWVSYVGIGFGDRLLPYFDTSDTMLFALPVVVASLLVPALALGGFAWTRCWRYGPFFLLLVLVGMLVVMAGFPPGTPFNRALEGVYYRLEPVQFLRTTYKAAPLVAIGLACLGGAAAAAGWRWLSREWGGRGGVARAARPLAAAAALALVALAAWPLVTGQAIDSQIAYDEVPEAWRAAARDLDRELPEGKRALVLPGQVFPFYRWGLPQDPILPALAERPVAVRGAVPYSDLHAVDLLVTTDSLVQQRRVLPGQLPPLLELLGAGAIVTGTDDDRLRSGAVDPHSAAAALRDGGVPAARRAYGPRRSFNPPAGEPGVPLALPQVRRHDLPPRGGIVRVKPARGETLLDGSAEGVAALASLGTLDPRRALLYAGDQDAAELRAAARRGAELVITDSNRRRWFLSSRTRQSVGPVQSARETLSRDAASLDPFGAGSAAQTVVEYRGVRELRSPTSPNFAQFPEHRPFAALDGREDTWWTADRNLDEDRHWLEVEFDEPRHVPYVDLLPQTESGSELTAVEIAGRRFAVRPGRQRLRLDLDDARRLRVRITKVRGPDDRERGPGAIAELRIPGLIVRERLRAPRRLERALAGADLTRSSLSYVFTRQTGDDPFRRAPRLDPQRGSVPRGRNQEAALAAEPGDPERGFGRRIAPPAARAYEADGWVSIDSRAPDHVLDRLAGEDARGRFDSSGRLLGLPRHRASRAFDGDPRSAWRADAVRGQAPWIAWQTGEPVSVERLELEFAPGAPAPRAARLRVGGRRSARTPVSRRGVVRLSGPLRGRRFRIELLGARPRDGASAGLAELRAPGVPRHQALVTGALPGRCEVEVRAAGRTLRMRPVGERADFEAGRPLRARPCGPGADLPAGPLTVETAEATWLPYVLRLRSPAPELQPAPVSGRVLDPGEDGLGEREGVRVELDRPSWIILGESFNEGWRAFCNGRSLGAPRGVDAFANGWLARPGCREVSFRFAPGGVLRLSYGLSALAVLALLALVLWPRRGTLAVARSGPRLTPAGATAAPAPLETAPAPSGEPAPLPLARALLAGAAIGLVCAFLFALRAGVVIGPAFALLLWRGVPARTLALAAGALLALVVPLVYVVFLPEDRGGFNSRYPVDLLGAHWVTLAALLLLALALWRTLATRRAGVSTASSPSGAPAPAREDAPAAAAQP